MKYQSNFESDKEIVEKWKEKGKKTFYFVFVFPTNIDFLILKSAILAKRTERKGVKVTDRNR